MTSLRERERERGEREREREREREMSSAFIAIIPKIHHLETNSICKDTYLVLVDYITPERNDTNYDLQQPEDKDKSRRVDSPGIFHVHDDCGQHL